MAYTREDLPPDFMPPVILGGSVNLLAGAPGVGKTAFLAWWVQQLQLNQPIFGLAPPPSVWQGMISADRSWAMSTSRWFELQGCAPFPAYSLQDDRGFKKARLRKRHDRISIFAECLDQLCPNANGVFPPYSIVYVDPLALFLGGNLLDYDVCMVACSEIRELCGERNVTVFGTAHAAKQKMNKEEGYLRLQDRILGSAALFGYTDTQMYLASPEEVGKDCYVFLLAPHHAKPRLFELVRDDAGRFLERPSDAASVTLRALPDVEWILMFLAEPRRYSEVFAAATVQGMSRETLRRRLKLLLATKQIMTPARGIYQRVLQ